MATYPSDWQSWAQGVLAGIGAPVNDTNLSTLWNWSHAESGSDVMRWLNPLNTTQNAAGATSQNSVGVKSYPDLATGIAATVETLLNGRYGQIVGNLQQSVPQSQWGNACTDLGVWGTGCGWLGALAPVTAGSGSSSSAQSAGAAASGDQFTIASLPGVGDLSVPKQPLIAAAVNAGAAILGLVLVVLGLIWLLGPRIQRGAQAAVPAAAAGAL